MVTKGSEIYIVRQGNLSEGLLLGTQVNDGRVTRTSTETLQVVMRISVEISGMTG